MSCVIGNIFAELSPPCEECGAERVTITGTTVTGNAATPILPCGEIPCRECPYYHKSYFCGYISEYCDVFGSFENH